MNVLCCKPMIDAMAAEFSAKYPWVDKDDFKGECWLEVFRARKLWTEGGCSFTSFVYKRMCWLKQQWLRNHSRRMDLEKEYAQQMTLIGINDLKYDETARYALTKLVMSFSEDDCRLCELYLNPTAEFLSFVENDRRLTDKARAVKDKRVTNEQFAKFLGKSRSWVEWRLRDIRRRLREITAETEA